MSDLINRQDVVNKILGLTTCKGFIPVSSVIWQIDQLPSAEPTLVEVLAYEAGKKSAERKGKWLRYGEDGYPNEDDTVIWQCDQCLETYYGRTTRIPNFCPNCGADMRERQASLPDDDSIYG